MKYIITADQKTFFARYQQVEFEGLLSEKELTVLTTAIHRRSLGGTKRDLARKDPEIEKIVYSNHLASIGAELIFTKQLRFGYDQLIELPIKEGVAPKTLQEMSSVRPLVMAMMICLEGVYEKPLDADEGFVPFPQKPANVTFFSPSCVWDCESLAARTKQQFLLVAFAGPRPLYVFEENDPYVHALKQLGYGFGDRLKEQSHPTLCRTHG